MLSDRSYMRDDYPRTGTSPLTWIISGLVAAFVLQCVFLRWFHGDQALENLLELSVANIKAGKLWTLVTYGLLHDTGNLLHIVGNLLGLYFLGRILLPLMGTRRFCWFLGTATATGGAFWLATNWHGGYGTAIGASAAVMGLFIVYACMNPDTPMTFLLFFVLPVTLKPKYVAFALLAVELLGFAFYEVMGAVSPFSSPVAHSAHLGGMAAGWVYFRFIHEGKWRLMSAHREVELPAWMHKKKAVEPAAYQVNLTSRDDLRAEVDRILDKINSHGFGSLTPDEKRLLDEAKDLLSRR